MGTACLQKQEVSLSNNKEFPSFSINESVFINNCLANCSKCKDAIFKESKNESISNSKTSKNSNIDHINLY